MKNFAWSYSALTRYEGCPKQYYHLNVVKDVKDEGSDVSREGQLIHEAVRARVIDGKALPLAYRHFERMVAPFASHRGEKHGEIRLALNRDFQQTDFFASDVFIRSVVDLLIVDRDSALIVDWKTGKVRPDFSQIRLSAAVLSCAMPEIEHFTLAFVWLKHKNVSTEKIWKSELPSVWSELLPRASKIEAAIKTTEFPARPSGLCKYCPVKTCPHTPR